MPILQVVAPFFPPPLSPVPTLSSSTGLAVGFSQAEFDANEGSMEAVFEVIVFGTIERSIVIQFMTANASAIGKQLLMYYKAVWSYNKPTSPNR